MGEIKSVKVDNWGVFFLQKLQNFFNKTDYCDLTLQFNDNSQLKVHRLVLSACTDYFNVLEQTCDVVDDALIMPNELQADVVVPIVNFMYTGTLEFELKMYGKLLRTAKEMNMTVLLKLLEAHRRTMEGVNRGQRPASPKSVRKRGPIPPTANVTHSQIRPLGNSSQQQQQQRRILTAANATAQRRLVQLKSIATNVSQSQMQQYRQPHGSASLLKPSTAASSQNLHRTTCEVASYTGDSATYEPAMQFKEEQNDDYETQLSTTNQSTSPFEQLRKGYNNNKRPASATFISPPAKKPNIEDVKEFAEQQRMRKQIAAEYGEDQEYESTMLDDDIHNDDDDDDTAAATSSSSIPVAPTPTITVRSQQQHQSGPSIIIKQEPNEKPTIVVKDISNSKMNHAKIISEVLRQYPHLVKSNKNIKLKIMPNAGGQSQKIIMKKEQISPEKNAQSVLATTGSGQTVLKPTSTQQKLAQLQETQKLTSVAPAAAVETSASQTSAATTGASTQKRRIDSKTMHALIALGAENMTGPWLCLRCGVNGRPISIPSYRGFRRHLINTHKEAIDPALCEHCGWRSTTNRELIFHIQVEHKIKTTMYVYPECLICSEVFLDTCALNQHMIDSHPEEDQQQCIYCNKIFAKELQLYTHMKTYHKMQAISDGIIDYSEDDDDGEDEPMESQEIAIPADCGDEKSDSPSFSSSHINKKINILSDISLPSANSLMNLERPRSGAAALTKIASGIAANIGLETSETETMNSEPKFVSADGNEMMLTDEQRKEIMSQLNQDHEGGVVMLLNESAFADADAAVAATVTNEEALADESPELAGPPANMEHETEEHTADTSTNEDDTSEYDDSNIYGEFISKGDVENKKEAGLDESKGSNDNLEWAENLLTAHELEDEEISEGEPKQAEKVVDKTQNVNDRKTDKDISQKLKELTGDWSDDEIEEDDAEEEDEEEEVKPTPEMSIHKDIEIEEKQNEVTEKTLNVVVSKAMEQSPEEEEAQVKKTEKTEDTPGEEKMDCKQIKENEPEDDIDMALETLHKEVEIKIENVTPETDAAVVSAGNSTNVEESEDNNYNQAECKEEVLNKIDHSLGKLSELTSDKTSSLAEETAIVTKNFEVKAAEKEEEEIETDPQNDKITCVKKDFPQEDDTKASVEESNLDMDIEMRDTAAETKAVAVETHKDIVATEITKEEPDVSTESATVTSKTEDKIKTLISEWGDDDDDEIEDVETLE